MGKNKCTVRAEAQHMRNILQLNGIACEITLCNWLEKGLSEVAQ